MTLYGFPFNQDVNGRWTSAHYDANVGGGDWANYSKAYHLNAANIWVPSGVVDPLPTVAQDVLRVVEVSTIDFATPSARTSAPSPNIRPMPHVAYGISTATVDPAVGSFVGNEFSTGAYAALAVYDGNTTSYNTGSATAGHHGQQLFEFNLLRALQNQIGLPPSWNGQTLAANLLSISITWYGFSVGANLGAPAYGTTFALWLPGSSTWDGAGASAANSVVTAETITGNVATPGTYVDSNGILRLKARSTYAADGVNPSTVTVDSIRMKVTLRAPVNGPRVQYPNQIIDRVSVSAGATVQSTIVNLQNLNSFGVTVSTDQNYDLIFYPGSGLSGVSVPAAITIASTQASTGTGSERFHSLSAFAGAREGRIGVKNLGGVAATTSARFMGHE